MQSIHIGRDCMLSYGIEIRTGDSHSIIQNDTNERINFSNSIEIGNHCWICAKATILKGVNIKDNCIIGNGCIVTKSFNQSNCIISGIPGKIVKENINWSREKL